MTTTKFDEFFYDNELVNLQDALDEKGTLDERYNRFFLYCPYCQSTRLKFFSQTSKKNAYLATWPGDVHPEECPASFTPAKKKEISDYYSGLSSKQIQDKLTSYLRRLTSKKDTKLIESASNCSAAISSVNKLASNKMKHILPQRTLDSIPIIDDNLRNIPILFHGKAYVEFTSAINPKYNQIHLKRASTKKLFLYMDNGETDSYVPKNIDNDTLYIVVFIGIYKSKNAFPELIKNGSFVIIPATSK